MLDLAPPDTCVLYYRSLPVLKASSTHLAKDSRYCAPSLVRGHLQSRCRRVMKSRLSQDVCKCTGSETQCLGLETCPYKRGYWALYLSVGGLMFVFSAAWIVLVVQVTAKLRTLPYHRFKCVLHLIQAAQHASCRNMMLYNACLKAARVHVMWY